MGQRRALSLSLALLEQAMAKAHGWELSHACLPLLAAVRRVAGRRSLDASAVRRRSIRVRLVRLVAVSPKAPDRCSYRLQPTSRIVADLFLPSLPPPAATRNVAPTSES